MGKLYSLKSSNEQLLARDTISWYWSVDILFSQVSIDYNMDGKYQRRTLSTYSRHLARPHHRRCHCRRRCREQAPKSNTASYDNHEKILSFIPIMSMGLRLADLRTTELRFEEVQILSNAF